MDAMARARSFLRSDACHRRFLALYGGGEADVSAQVARYGAVLDKFSGLFPGHADVAFVSAPGRAEIGGNHTDHQNGRVLAAAVNLDTVAVAAPNGGMAARVHSEGFGLTEVDLMDLAPRPPKGESGTAAMIRGCAARMRALGLPISGFDAAATSAVGTGSGLSSSAAFEVLIVTILDSLFGAGDMDPVLRAQIAQHAENHFVHKPSGLMDQTASSVGGLVAIDFEPQGGDSLRNPFHGAESSVPRHRHDAPVVTPLQYDFAAKGYALAVVDTRGDHGGLTDAYAAIRQEMEQVAACFGQARLRPVDAARFEAELPGLCGRVPDRAILRALHFFDENARVAEQVAALKADDLPRFLELINESGQSSLALLQNLSVGGPEQEIPLALELSRRMLAGRGAWRVHGGGFAGTILSFVPLDLMDAYAARMDAVFGAGACARLMIRPEGAVVLRG